MKNTFLILTFLTVCFLGNKVSGQTVTPLTTAEFKEKIWNFETDEPAIIDMYATWCGPCKRLAPILEEIQKDYGQKLQIYKVDTDKETQLSRLFNVSSIPLMVFIPVKGKPFLVSGLRPKEQLVQIIKENLIPETTPNTPKSTSGTSK